MEFTHETLAQRVAFGAGRAAHNVAEQVARLGGERVMLIAGAHGQELAATAIGSIRPVLRWDDVVPHVPVEVAERARAAADEADVDVIVCVGGGSTTGLAKAVALTSGRPIVAVPTTYAGSEATNVWGLTSDRTKTTGVDPAVLPAAVVYDPDLTSGLPVELSVASGLNGLAHCVDSMWAPRADPINRALALEGTRAIAQGLPRIVDDAGDTQGREQVLYGAYLAAVAFTSAGSGMHHKICHVLGGTFDLPHAQTHAIVLPHVLAFNAPGAPDAAYALAEALGARPAAACEGPQAAVDALDVLLRRVRAPRALADVGLSAGDVPEAVRRSLDVIPTSNPVTATAANLTALLTAALDGTTPGGRS